MKFNILFFFENLSINTVVCHNNTVVCHNNTIVCHNNTFVCHNSTVVCHNNKSCVTTTQSCVTTIQLCHNNTVVCHNNTVVSQKSDSNAGTAHEHQYTFLIRYRWILHRIGNVFWTTVVESTKTQILCSVTFFPRKSCRFEIVWKYRVDRPQMTIWRFACWIT